MLKGIDVSHWNKDINYDEPSFIIIKASEGVKYKDPMLDEHYNKFSKRVDGKPVNKLYGFYHYARPETGNTPEQEADSFLGYIGHHVGNCLLALDWEQKALTQPIEWAEQFLDYVYMNTGVKPLIYCSASVTPKLKNIYKKDYGLWVAHYGVNSPKISTYPFWAMWQYTSTPLDYNYFNGNEKTFRKYCEVR